MTSSFLTLVPGSGRVSEKLVFATLHDGKNFCLLCPTLEVALILDDLTFQLWSLSLLYYFSGLLFLATF